MFAHSLEGELEERWEPLAHHLAAVGSTAARFAAPFGWAGLAEAAGRLHDIGKCSTEYQNYIRLPRAEGRKGPDHSTAGAREAARLYPGFSRLLSFIIAGHHAGLADGEQLEGRMSSETYAIKTYADWRAHTGDLPRLSDFKPTTLAAGPSPHLGFSMAFLTRMLFSCLVDADFLETEAFYARANGENVERGGFNSIAELRTKLRTHMAEKTARAESSELNVLRTQVLRHAIDKAAMSPGLFTLTVPTGGGKTLASLSFALEHAVRHGLERVIYVIPFTSIIEQTASVFRQALGDTDDILEHHSSFDWEPQGVDDAEGRDGLRKLQRAAENWDAPVVVTTAVQFFESLHAKRTSRCRKLHNLSRSVIVLDEAQTLPLPLLAPCLAALDELQRNYGTSIVLCTATQPALRVQDGALPERLRLDIPPDRELAPDPPSLYRALKRVQVEVRRGETTDAEIAARFGAQEQMLCIVNSRAHARTLYDAVRNLPGAIYLTTLMCPLHRRCVLADVRARLKDRAPVRLVATSLIEAGVDVDFPEVWRAAAGIDQIAQAAGRCNREGNLTDGGRMVVFEPSADHKPPQVLKSFWQAARPILSNHADPLSLEAVKAYFRELYWQKGADSREDALDAARLEGETFPILRSIRERANDWSFEFEKIARAFRIIDEAMDPVIVPWRAHDGDEDACDLLRKIFIADRPHRRDLRRLQLYTVSIPPKSRSNWLAAGVLRPVHPALGDALLCFDDLAHYGANTGIDLSTPDYRAAENNVF